MRLAAILLCTLVLSSSLFAQASISALIDQNQLVFLKKTVTQEGSRTVTTEDRNSFQLGANLQKALENNKTYRVVLSDEPTKAIVLVISTEYKLIGENKSVLHLATYSTSLGAFEVLSTFPLAAGYYADATFDAKKLKNGNIAVAAGSSYDSMGDSIPASTLFLFSPDLHLVKSFDIDQQADALGTLIGADNEEAVYIFGPSNYHIGFHQSYHHKNRTVWLFDDNLVHMKKVELNTMDAKLIGVKGGKVLLESYDGKTKYSVTPSGDLSIQK